MTLLINSTNNDLSNLITDSELKEQLLELSKAYKKVLNKPFSIGIMGKAGAGKSSFVNALCQKNICQTGGVGGCTREVQKIEAKLGEMDIHIYDFPGIAENSQWNEKYWELYLPYLEQLDRIFWLIKVDDRAIFEDEKFYTKYIDSNYEIRDKFVIILSQADKAEPHREWNYQDFMPSSSQLVKISENRRRICKDFMNGLSAERIIAIATDFYAQRFSLYGFDNIFNMLSITLNNIGKVSDEVPFYISIAVTQKEMKSLSEAMKWLREDTEIEMEKLKENISFFRNFF